MELPLTADKLREMTNFIDMDRELDLMRIVSTDLRSPILVLQQLEQDLKDSIYKKEKRTHFSYELNRYYRIYRTFGKADADHAILKVANDYVCDYFPSATVAIESTDGMSCMLVLHFSLPWLSGQTNSRPEQPT